MHLYSEVDPFIEITPGFYIERHTYTWARIFRPANHCALTVARVHCPQLLVMKL